MVWGCGLWEVIRNKDKALMNGMRVLEKEELPAHLRQMRAEPDDEKTKMLALTRHRMCQPLAVGAFGLQNCKT